MAIVTLGAGDGAGYLAKAFAGAPERTEVLCALGALFALGRFVERYFSTAQLDRVDARIARLERATKR